MCRQRDFCAIASVGGRNEAAQRHDDRAQPDIAHQRLVLDAHAPGAFAEGVAHGHEQVARPVDRDRGLAIVGLLHPVVTLLRLQDRHRPSRARDFHQGLHGIVIRPAYVDGIDEPKIVPGDGETAARFQGHVLLYFIALDPARADGKHAHAQMGDRHAEHRGRDFEPLTPAAQRLEHRGEDDPEAETEAQQPHPMDGAEYQALDGEREDHGKRQQPPQRLGRHRELAAAPGRVHADGEKHHQRHHGNQEHHREHWRPHRNLAYT